MFRARNAISLIDRRQDLDKLGAPSGRLQYVSLTGICTWFAVRTGAVVRVKLQVEVCTLRSFERGGEN